MGSASEKLRESSPARVIPYERRFEADVVEVCWRTGLMGESLEGTGRFEDRRLFGLLFCLQYLEASPGTCFVAVAPDPGRLGAERAVGYVLGAPDAAAFKRDFGRRMLPRILARLLALDWWRYPESFRQTLAFARAARAIEASGALSPALGGPEYPAELHINLAPGWQGRGLGGELVAALVGALRERGCPGVFLETSDRNLKALPFYRKLGFEPAGEVPASLWEGLPARTLAMTLRLDS